MRTAAIIGCGKNQPGKEGWGIANAHAHGWREADPDVRLLAVDISEENLTAFGETYGLGQEDLFRSTDDLYNTLTPDFVSICTWPGLHAPMVIQAAERGVSGIACEKPLALDCGEITAMRTACEKAGARLAVAHQRRHNPLSKLTRELLADGRLGEGLVLEARVGDRWDILSWSVHWFDLANYLFNAAPVSVLAAIDHTGTRRYRHAVEDSSVIFMEYPDNRQAIFITGPDNPQQDPIVVRGSKGLLRFHESAGVQVIDQHGLQTYSAERELGDFGALLTELINGVETGAEMLNDVANSGLATELAYAAHESARTMRKIELPFTAAYAPLEVEQHRPTLATSGLKSVLYADEHFGSGGAGGLSDALTAITGISPSVINAESDGLTGASITNAQVLVLYHTRKESDDTTRATLTEWVEAGKPLLIVHAGLGAWPEWRAFAEWAGYIWEWGVSSHPHEPATLVPADGDPLGLGWKEGWLPRDESFIDLKRTSPTVGLLHATISSGTYPAAWINQQHTNVGGWMPGHREDSWRVPAMREGLAALLRAVALS